MEQRIVGIETEFGCMVQSDRLGGRGSSERMVEAVKDHAFLRKRLGLARYARARLRL